MLRLFWIIQLNTRMYLMNNQLKNLNFFLFLIPLLSLTLISCGGSSDNGGGSNPLPANQAPIANAGEDKTVDEGNTITLSGSGTDSDGSISSYSWTQTSGESVTINNPTSNSASFDITTTTKVTLAFQLRVTDDDGATGNDTVNFTINPFNTVPIADAGEDQSVYEGITVTLDATGSQDNDGSIVSFNWVQTSGVTVNLSDSSDTNPTFTTPNISKAEKLVFELEVTDNESLVNIDSIDVYVSKLKKIPLNDTGISYWSGGFEGQDAAYGRDAQAKDGVLVKVGAGREGFDFTKLDSNGEALDVNATEWSCVRDNNTGYIWEIKTIDDGLHDQNDRFTWYDTNNDTNGGAEGFSDSKGDICYGYNAGVEGSFCNTSDYIGRVNSNNFCGANDWYLPTVEEIRSIVDYGTNKPVVDIDYFPNTIEYFYWTSTPTSETGARPFHFGAGFNTTTHKDAPLNVRLVRKLK